MDPRYERALLAGATAFASVLSLLFAREPRLPTAIELYGAGLGFFTAFVLALTGSNVSGGIKAAAVRRLRK